MSVRRRLALSAARRRFSLLFVGELGGDLLVPTGNFAGLVTLIGSMSGTLIGPTGNLTGDLPHVKPKVETLVDDFEDGTINTTLWPTAKRWGTPTESGGYLSLDPNSGGGEGVMTADEAYSLRDSFLVWGVNQVPAVVGTGGAVEGGVAYVKPSAGHYLRVIYNRAGGTSSTVSCTFQSYTGSFTTLWSDTFDPTNHKYAMISEASGTTYFYTGPSISGPWTLRWSGANISTVNYDAGRVDLFASSASVTSPGAITPFRLERVGPA